MSLRGDESRQSEWCILYRLVVLRIDEDPDDHGSAGRAGPTDWQKK